MNQINLFTYATGEGSPNVEKAEEQILGQQNHQKIEVIHRFANNHPVLFYSAVILVLVIVAYLIILTVIKLRK